MLSLSFWAAFALVFFGLKWLAEAWLLLPGPKRNTRPTPHPRAISHPTGSAVPVRLPDAA